MACREGHLDIVRWLVDQKQVDCFCQIKGGETPLLMAIKNSHLGIVQHLVEKQVDPSYCNEDGFTLLHLASLHGQLDIAKWLVDEKQLDPLCLNYKMNGFTPLICASGSGQLDIVRWLVDEKNIDLFYEDGLSNALRAAIMFGHFNIVNEKQSIISQHGLGSSYHADVESLASTEGISGGECTSVIDIYRMVAITSHNKTKHFCVARHITVYSQWYRLPLMLLECHPKCFYHKQLLTKCISFPMASFSEVWGKSCSTSSKLWLISACAYDPRR